jgi:uncharacterized protein (DUF58 family)
MKTLIPASISAPARPLVGAKGFAGMGKRGRWIFLGILCLLTLWPAWFHHSWIWGALAADVIVCVLILRDLALTNRALLLLLAGIVAAIPAFYHPNRIWLMLAWDACVFILCAFDAATLPAPSRISVSRTFLDSPRLGELTRVELEVTQQSNRLVEVDITDDLESSLMPTPEMKRVLAYPRDPVRAILDCFPGRRGDLRLGNVYLRYRSMLRLVERRAVCEMTQDIRVFPAMSQSGHSSSLFLMRARQIELQKRRLRQRGIGREFDCLRDYQRGDELRNLSWTATARRGKLITRQYTTERSQQVWIVLDAGRLSRTAFSLRRRGPRTIAETEHEAADNLQLTVTQLDQAATASVMLAETVGSSGDKCGLLTYGRSIQQQLLPGAGAPHLRTMIDQLSQVRGEAAEANHLHAAARLKNLQRRRGLIVWITEIADSAGRPEVVSAAADLARRHLVLLVVLHHPELDKLAAHTAATVTQMFDSAAAKEMLDRRRETIAKLRQQGVLGVEATPGEIGLKAINSYLDVKAGGLI